MPKAAPKKKKKLSYEQRCRIMKKRRKNLSEEQKQKIKEYNRARSMRARENETPMAREIRLQRGREMSRRRRMKRKAQTDREKKRAALLAAKNAPVNPSPVPVAKPTPPPAPTSRRMPRLINISQMRNPPNKNFPSGFMPYNANMKSGPRPVEVRKPSEMPLPFVNYKPSFPQKMKMPPTNINDNYDDMATVCPIECNVEYNITPEPLRRFTQSNNPVNRTKLSGDVIVKNIGAHVVMKKKVVNQTQPESVRQQNGSASDWNGTASVCPIECNVDITDPSDSFHQRAPPENLTMKRNSLLDSLKQMGTHVIIKKKSDFSDRNANLRPSSYKTAIPRTLPVECSVDITPIDSRLKSSSEITIMKHNGNNSIKRLGSQIMVQKVKKPQQSQPKGYESSEDNHEDFDMTCPIECNVFISESS